MYYTACFTGHRPQNLPCKFDETHIVCLKIKRQLKKLIKDLIDERDVRHFISGMALGVDMWAAEIVLELKKKYSDITLEAAIPCRSQPDRWNSKEKKRYADLLSQCDVVTYVQEQYSNSCMMKRNRYMVDNSDFIAAVWNGGSSGTGNTVKYAAKCKKYVFYIDTDTFRIKKPELR